MFAWVLARLLLFLLEKQNYEKLSFLKTIDQKITEILLDLSLQKVKKVILHIRSQTLEKCFHWKEKWFPNFLPYSRML